MQLEKFYGEFYGDCDNMWLLGVVEEDVVGGCFGVLWNGVDFW